MNWKAINLHIENLVPGILLLVEFQVLFAKCGDMIKSLGSDRPTLLIPFFLALAYSLGVISAVLTRFLVDGISESGPRAWVFSLLAHHDPLKIGARLKTDDRGFEEDFEEESKKWYRPIHVARWNSIYRGALRAVVNSGNERAKEEISRRREQCRLMRNLFFPSVIGMYLLAEGSHAVGWTVAAVVFSLFLYAYSELNIFAEAADLFVRYGTCGDNNVAAHSGDNPMRETKP